MSHSPLPWTVKHGRELFSADGIAIANIGEGILGGGEPQFREDADFIARAVNSHEELLLAAKIAREMIHQELCDKGSNVMACLSLNKAISKAEGPK